MQSVQYKNFVLLYQTRYAHMLAELFNHAFNAQVSYNIAVDLQYVVYQVGNYTYS